MRGLLCDCFTITIYRPLENTSLASLSCDRVSLHIGHRASTSNLSVFHNSSWPRYRLPIRCAGSYPPYRVLLDTLASSTFLLRWTLGGSKQIGMLQKSEHCLLVVSTQSRKTWQAGKVSGQLNGNLCRYSTGNRLDSPFKMDILLVLIPIQHVQQLSLRISFGMLFRTLGGSPRERSHSNS